MKTYRLYWVRDEAGHVGRRWVIDEGPGMINPQYFETIMIHSAVDMMTVNHPPHLPRKVQEPVGYLQLKAELWVDPTDSRHAHLQIPQGGYSNK